MFFRLEEATESLARTPRILDAMLRDRSEAWLQARTAPDAFSPVDVVGHLILADTTNWIPRLRMILEHRDTRAFEPFDRFAFQPIVAEKSIDALLDEFASLRRQSLQTLTGFHLSEADLALPGKHPEFGRITLGNLQATWVVHDLGHITQIAKTMAGEYVRPWARGARTWGFCVRPQTPGSRHSAGEGAASFTLRRHPILVMATKLNPR